MEIKLLKVRIAFAELFEAKQVMNQGEPRFSASFILPRDHQSIPNIKKIVEEAAKTKWNDKAALILESLYTQQRVCLRDGNHKPEYDGFPGNFYVAANSKARPLVIDRDKTILTAADGRPYSGCYVHALLDIWAQDNSYGKRINASLKGVQFVEDGDAFSASAPASPDAFDDLGEGVDASGGLI